MVGAYFRLCQAGILVARIARRALPTLKSKRAIWLTILFHRSLSFRRRGKNCSVRTATPRPSISGPICGMTRNDWATQTLPGTIRISGVGVMSPRQVKGPGIEDGSRPRGGMGLGKKQCEGSNPFLLDLQVTVLAQFGQREDLPKIAMAPISGCGWDRRSTSKSAIEKRESWTARPREHPSADTLVLRCKALRLNI